MRRFELVAIALAALVTSCSLPPPEPRTETPPPVMIPKPGTPPGPAPVPPPGRPTKVDREPMIDVGLAWDVDEIQVVSDELSSSGRFREVAIGSTRQNAERVNGPRRYRVEGGRLRADTPANPRESRLLDPADTLEIDGGGRIAWNGKTWRGAFRIFVNPRGKLTLVTRLPLEHYLLGVIPGEIGALAENLIEAGRAQAIAARSYTLFYMGRRATEGFDLYGTTEDQVYGPIESERPLATRVVESTRGLIAFSAGRPIRANYSSTCGGITSEVWEAWPTGPLPYLVSHRDSDLRGADYCAASPHYRWREEWSPGELTSNVARHGPLQGVALPVAGMGELVDVRVASRSRSGRVWRLSLVTTTGEVSIPAWSLRQVLRRGGSPAAILRSNLFKVDVRRDRSSGRALAIVASGAGNGHGAGLCQTGALGMARAGEKGEEILRHYYRSVSLERRY